MQGEKNMIEIVFSNSVAGTLKYFRDDITEFGFNKNDIYAFPLALSIGNISKDNFWQNRSDTLQSMSVSPYRKISFESEIKKLDEVKSRIKDAETVRIWYSCQPDELCGLYWFLYEIRELNAKVFVIELPKILATENGVVEFNSFNQVLAENINEIL